MITTTIQNQAVEIHFNTSSDYDYRCYVQQFSIKLNLSRMSHVEYKNIRERLCYRFGENALCVHGLGEQELIFVFKPEEEITFFFNIHELDSVLTRVIDSIKQIYLNMYDAVGKKDDRQSSLDLVLYGQSIPYVLEVSLTNIR